MLPSSTKLPPGAKKKRNKNKKKKKLKPPTLDAKQQNTQQNQDRSVSSSRSRSRSRSRSHSSAGETDEEESEDEEEGREGYRQGGYHPVKVHYKCPNIQTPKCMNGSHKTHIEYHFCLSASLAHLFCRFPQIGEVYNDRFKIISKLGWGHFSTVWMALDKNDRSYVGLKIQKSAEHYREAAWDEIELLQVCK